MIPSLEILGTAAPAPAEGAAAPEEEGVGAGHKFRDLLESDVATRRPVRGKALVGTDDADGEQAIAPPAAQAQLAAPLALDLRVLSTPQAAEGAAGPTSSPALAKAVEGLPQATTEEAPTTAMAALQPGLPAGALTEGKVDLAALPSPASSLALFPAAHSPASPDKAGRVEGPAFPPDRSMGEGEDGPSLRPDTASLSAQRGTAENPGSVSAPGPRPEAGTVIQPDEITPNTDLAVKIAAQQDSPKRQTMLRSVTSQAHSVLIWQAGSGEGAVAALPASAQGTAQSARAAATDVLPGADTEWSTDPATVPRDIAPPGPAESGPQISAALPQLPSQPAPATATTPASPLPAPFQPLVQAIHSHARAKTGPKGAEGGTDLMLNPVELGRVHFALSGSGDRMTITITADNPDTRHLLQTHAAELRTELERAGLGQADLNFAGAGTDRGGNRGAFARPQSDARSGTIAEPFADLPSPAPPPRAASDGLDLRL